MTVVFFEKECHAVSTPRLARSVLVLVSLGIIAGVACRSRIALVSTYLDVAYVTSGASVATACGPDGSWTIARTQYRKRYPWLPGPTVRATESYA